MATSQNARTNDSSSLKFWRSAQIDAKNVRAFLKELNQFDFNRENIDRVWQVIFPHKNSYSYIHITQYRDTYYLTNIDGKRSVLEVPPDEPISAYKHTLGISYDTMEGWDDLIVSASAWLEKVKKDWVKAYKQLVKEYPLNKRYGTISHALIQQLPLDLYRYGEDVKKADIKKFIKLVDDNFFFYSHKNSANPNITVNQYFDYYKIAYLALAGKKNPVNASLSGRELFKKNCFYGDEGLLDVPADSPEEFAKWIDNNTNHRVWAIRPGGSRTRIFLSVSTLDRREERSVMLYGGGTQSLPEESIPMVLAIHAAGLPITIEDAENIRKRLLAMDNIGIMPSYNIFRAGAHHFNKEQNVFSTIFYDDLKRYKRSMLPYITWDPLPVLKPRE